MSKSTDPSIHEIVIECVHKIVQIIVRSRIPADPERPLKETAKRNQWFNLEQHDLPLIRQRVDTEVKLYGPDVHVDVFVKANDGDASRILLERWTIQYDKSTESRSGPKTRVEPSNMYKRLIILVRSLYSYLRVLPSHNLVKRANNILADGQIPCFRLEADVSGSNTSDSFDRPPENFCFTSINTGEGRLHFSVFYRSDCDFSWAQSQPITDALIMDDYMNGSAGSPGGPIDVSGKPEGGSPPRHSRPDQNMRPAHALNPNSGFRQDPGLFKAPAPQQGSPGQSPFRLPSRPQGSDGHSPRQRTGSSNQRTPPRLANPIHHSGSPSSRVRDLSTTPSDELPSYSVSQSSQPSHLPHHTDPGPDFSNCVTTGDSESELGSFISALQSMPELHLLVGLEKPTRQSLCEALDSLQDLHDDLLEQTNQQAQQTQPPQSGMPIPHTGGGSWSGSRRNSGHYGTGAGFSPGTEGGHLAGSARGGAGGSGGFYAPPRYADRSSSELLGGQDPRAGPPQSSGPWQHRPEQQPRRGSHGQLVGHGTTPPMYIPQPSAHSNVAMGGWLGGQESGQFVGSAPTPGYNRLYDADARVGSSYEKNYHNLHKSSSAAGVYGSPRTHYSHPQGPMGFEGSYDAYPDVGTQFEYYASGHHQNALSTSASGVGSVANSMSADRGWQRRGSLPQRHTSDWEQTADGHDGGLAMRPNPNYHNRRGSSPTAAASAHHSQHMAAVEAAQAAATASHSNTYMRDQRRPVGSSFHDTYGPPLARQSQQGMQDGPGSMARMRTYTDPVSSWRQGEPPNYAGGNPGPYWDGELEYEKYETPRQRSRQPSPSNMYDPRVRSNPIAIGHGEEIGSYGHGGGHNHSGHGAHVGSMGIRNATPPFADSYGSHHGSHHSSPSTSLLYGPGGAPSNSRSAGAGGMFPGTGSPEADPYRHEGFGAPAALGPSSWHDRAAGGLSNTSF